MKSHQTPKQTRLLRTVLCLLSLACSLPCQGQVWPTSSYSNEPTVRAVRRVMPAVVNISIHSRPRGLVSNDFLNFVPKKIRLNANLEVLSLGSGFIVDRNGYIITNEHVVRRAEGMEILVTTDKGEVLPATYIQGDPRTDLAMIKVQGSSKNTRFPFLDVNRLSRNEVGQTVIALGNPMGYGNSISRGVLSAVNRTVSVDNRTFQGLIQTDAAINPGNSGGPIVDLRGYLVGVSSIKLAYSDDGVPLHGMGFAIPGAAVAEAVRYFKSAPKTASFPQRSSRQIVSMGNHFGLQIAPITPTLAAQLGIPIVPAVFINQIMRGSPADHAGLKPGELIFKIGNTLTASARDVDLALSQVGSGETIPVEAGRVVDRNGYPWKRSRTVTLRLR